MKSNSIRIISVVLQVLNVAAYTTSFLDAKTAALVAASLLIAKDTLMGIADILDDGQKNNSFKN